MWSPPAALGPGELTLWMGAAVILFQMGINVYMMPHDALGAELSTDYHDRNRIFGTRRIVFGVGALLVFAAVGRLAASPAPRSDAATIAFAAASVTAALMLYMGIVIRERPEYQGRGAARPFQALADVWRNPHARLLLIVSFIESLGGGVLGVLAPFFAEYVLQRPQTVAFIPAFFVVSSVVSVPAWLWLSRRYGKKRVWLWAMWATAFSFGATMLAGEGDVALLCALMTVAGFAGGCGGAVGSSLVADVVDWDEHATGQRKEGAYTAAAAFAQKAAVGLTVSVVGFALQASGFRPNVEQTAGALWALKGIFGGAPLVAYTIGALLFTRFVFDEQEHARLRKELDARAMSEA